MENVSGERARLAGSTQGLNGIVDRCRAKLRIAVGVLVAAAALAPGAATAAAGTLRSGDYTGPEGALHYQVYVPSSYTPGTAVPLVVALHGCTQTADSFRQLTRWDAQAEAKGFIAVFPEQSSSANTFKCWNFFQETSMHRSAGDPARIAAVTSLIENSYNVDPHRVYVTGFSAGGAMTSVMAATYPDYFAAIGIGSGCEYAATAACASGKSADPVLAGGQAYREMGARARPMPFIAVHGDADTVVPPENGDQLVQQWLTTDDLADDGAANGSVPSTPSNTNLGFAQGTRFHTIRTYADSRKSQLGQYLVVQGMKHAWSGGDASQAYSDPSGPDATAAMYAFFESHPAPSLTRPAPPAGSRKSAASTAASTAVGLGVPTVSKPKRSHGRIVFRISGPGSVTLRLQRRVAGHLHSGRCVTGQRKRRACTRYSTRAKIVRTVATAGRIAIPLPKKLRAGRFRAVLTPADFAGHTGRSRTLALVMR